MNPYFENVFQSFKALFYDEWISLILRCHYALPLNFLLLTFDALELQNLFATQGLKIKRKNLFFLHFSEILFVLKSFEPLVWKASQAEVIYN